MESREQIFAPKFIRVNAARARQLKRFEKRNIHANAEMERKGDEAIQYRSLDRRL